MHPLSSNHHAQSLNCIKISYYIDDGYTGTSFNHPAMQALLSLASEGRAGIIIVKYVSRPSYGCQDDPAQKGHWIVDEEAAPVEKRIFHLVLEGKGPHPEPERIHRLRLQLQNLPRKS